MKRSFLSLISAIVVFSGSAYAQQTTFTGTAVAFGSGFSTRTVTRTFTLRITGQTSDAEAHEFLNILKDKGQTGLRNAMNGHDLGSISVDGHIGPTINAVRVANIDGTLRIRVVFERWITFWELRRGYRSTDYPFGYMEMFVDPRTGKGEGTFIAAAKIRFRSDRNEVEVEDFGTFPGRLLGIRMRGAPLL